MEFKECQGIYIYYSCATLLCVDKYECTKTCMLVTLAMWKATDVRNNIVID
jgi:hypothetical protein